MRHANSCRRQLSERQTGPAVAGTPSAGDDQALFGILQGGTDETLREKSAQGLLELDFPGYAVGGLSVGETPEAMYSTLDFTVRCCPGTGPAI